MQQDNESSTLPLEQLRQIRISKIHELEKSGINPYPQDSFAKEQIKDVLNKKEGEKVLTAGRVLAIREHGKLLFLDLKDFSSKIQLVVRTDELSAKEKIVVTNLDIGDFVKIEGVTYITKTKEFSIMVSTVKLLSKSIRPLPNKISGFKDKEEKYRQRYADMILDEKTFNTLVTRSQIMQLVRRYFLEQKFLEVNTPVLQEMYGGANAKPFMTHHNALDTEFYLRISPELFLKRLIVGGFEKIFEFTTNFRNEGLSRWHNPEFLNVECYWAYSDYEDLMKFTQNLFKFLVQNLKGSLTFEYDGQKIDFTKDIPILTYQSALIKYAGIDYKVFDTEDKLRKEIARLNLLNAADLKTIGYSNLLDVLYKRTTRPKLINPVFLIDYPAEMIALAKRKENDDTTIATFQLVILGEEYVKAYNELNNPIDQRQRWQESEKLALKGQEEAERLDEDYIRAMEYGMPPTAGWGLGLERTIALLTDNHSIKDVMYFPTLRPVKVL